MFPIAHWAQREHYRFKFFVCLFMTVFGVLRQSLTHTGLEWAM